MPDHVALVALFWFVLWTGVGVVVGSVMFGEPRTGAVYGFFLAFVACFTWPWIMPDFIGDWMDDPA
jgi:hypothetical protein